ncbi:MAG TPA: PcfJ domain-containing protein [Polyangiaceae bacterium]|nr:PcfJ domain-containing protein [Polyangiaceae bacterium]
MNRRRRQQIRDSANALKKQRAQLARPKASHAAVVRRVSGAERTVQQALEHCNDRMVGTLFAKVRALPRVATSERLMLTVAREAPRLIDPDYVGALYWLGRLPWRAPLDEWRKSGKGRATVFRTLAEHLIGRYELPPFLYNAFFEEDAQVLTPVVAELAAGGSLFRACEAGMLPLSLTRRMCHMALSSPRQTLFLSAMRNAQLRIAGVPPRLLSAWMMVGPARRLQGEQEEAFWWTFVRWLAACPEPEPSELAPLCDYIGHLRQGDPNFRMKGRSAHALLRGMHQWHHQLAKVRVSIDRSFEASGFSPGQYDRSRRDADGNHRIAVWRMEEILSAAALALEGRRMRHCVYSYASNIEMGNCSIWSLTLDEGRGPAPCLTVEVNGRGQIVQARGRLNRVATSQEHQVLMTWAGENGLEVRTGT